MIDIEKKKQDFVDGLFFRHQLYYFSNEEMINCIKDDDHFQAFLDAALNFVIFDFAFMFYSPDFAYKIQGVLNSRRWNTRDKKVIEEINDVLRILGTLDGMKQREKKKFMSFYGAEQEKFRHTTFKSDEELLESLSYDYVVYYAIKYSMLDLIEEDKYPIVPFSLIYLFLKCPELFQDPDFMKNAEELYERVKNAVTSKNKSKGQKVKEFLELAVFFKKEE